MSDFDKLRKKVAEGRDWRGTIRVNIDGDELELTVRQLRDPEYYDVLSSIDRDELQELRDAYPQDVLEEYRELQNSEEDLTDEEQERFEELRDTLEEESPDFTNVLSQSTFDGIRQCAKYAVEPDDEDLASAFQSRAAEIEREYNTKVQTPEDVRPALQDELEELIDDATDFASFTIGMQALVQTVGEDEGN